MCCRFTQEVHRYFVITICFTSVISVFSVANQVFKVYMTRSIRPIFVCESRS